jgi:hypothetical protein
MASVPFLLLLVIGSVDMSKAKQNYSSMSYYLESRNQKANVAEKARPLPVDSSRFQGGWVRDVWLG